MKHRRLIAAAAGAFVILCLVGSGNAQQWPTMKDKHRIGGIPPVTLYADDRYVDASSGRCRDASVTHFEVYLQKSSQSFKPSQLLEDNFPGNLRGTLRLRCPNLATVTVHMMERNSIQPLYKIVPEGLSGTVLIYRLDNFAVISMDTADVRNSFAIKMGFDRAKYHYGHTIQNILDERYDFVRGSQATYYNLGNMFAHYTVAYGQSKCVKDPEQFRLTRSTTTRQVLWGGFVSMWTNTNTDTVKLDKRHAKDFEAAFDARRAVFNAVNRGMWEDILLFFENHACSDPIHARFEKNLIIVKSGKDIAERQAAIATQQREVQAQMSRQAKRMQAACETNFRETESRINPPPKGWTTEWCSCVSRNLELVLTAQEKTEFFSDPRTFINRAQPSRFNGPPSRLEPPIAKCR